MRLLRILALLCAVTLIYCSDWRVFGMNNFAYFVKYSGIGKDFRAAEKHCQDMGAHLASIHSELENTFILDLAKDVILEQPRYAVEDQLLFGIQIDWKNGPKNGTFSYIDGTKYDFGKWSKGEPNNAFSTERCGVIVRHGGSTNFHAVSEWNDVNCNLLFAGHVCKKRNFPNKDHDLVPATLINKESPGVRFQDHIIIVLLALLVIVLCFQFIFAICRFGCNQVENQQPFTQHGSLCTFPFREPRYETITLRGDYVPRY